MSKQNIIDFLKKSGVCTICQLRYLKARGKEYENVKETFENLHVKYETPETDTNETNDNGCLSKKQRLNPCPTCLDLFSENFQQQLIQEILATDIKKYECDSIVIAISLPILSQIRQLSMWHALLREFPKNVDNQRPPDVPLKEAIKLIINPTICKQLKKSYDVNGLMISINLAHEEEENEVQCLRKLHDVAYPKKSGKRIEISRGVLEKLYTPAQVNTQLFEEHIPVPPSVATHSFKLAGISLTGPTVFVAGRYRKISRQLSHTPWILDGKRVMEDSIEEIIVNSVGPHFCADKSKIIFMSSGREDVDVRCLGKGRPFVVEIPNSLRTTLTKELACQIEQEIDKSRKVSVRNLQLVQREELVHIKTGEEHKRKFYRALCKLDQPATVEVLEKLNLPNGFEIQQKTPLRVLHRRPLHTRPRKIYSLKAFVQKENLHVLVLDIVSQAGTYIKELVHGDFERTKPSIATLIEQPIDIIALDVVAIELDWPPYIDNQL